VADFNSYLRTQNRLNPARKVSFHRKLDVMGLRDVLNDDVLFKLAGERSYTSGQKYLEEGRVGSLRTAPASISATVQGTNLYRATLSVNDNKLEYDCECPFGRDDVFCKHCVAVGLLWLDGIGKHDEDILTILQSLDKSALINLLSVEASQNHILKVRILEQATNAGNSQK